MFKNFAKVALRLTPVAVIPWAFSPYQPFFWDKKSKLKPNLLSERVHQIVLESNNPCQDRKDVLQLTAIEGYAAAVYDGHGGWQVSDICSQKLLKALDILLKTNKQSNKYQDVDQLITQSIKQAFQFVQDSYIKQAKIAYKLGFGRAARAGSCALVCVVHNNKVYCGNVGDSMGLIIEDNKPMGYTQINRFLNADNPDQQKRLKQAFPTEQSIVVCKKPQNKSCYVKGRLQPTRSIGDLRLKLQQFNNPKNYSSAQEFQPPLSPFVGNYITAQPQVQIFNLNKNQKWIILASDGLWDELGFQEVAQVFKNQPIEKVNSTLIAKCLQKASSSSKLSVEEIKKIPQGKKRHIHDDITIVVLDLKDQVK